MISFRKETFLAPGNPDSDGFRPTTRRTRVTRHSSRVDTVSDRARWGGVALVTVLTASLTAWSSAELLASPYGSKSWSPVWLLGLGLGLVADALWIIMLLLQRRARATLRTNLQAEKAGWGFAAVSVVIIAGHALVDGAGIRSWQDFTLWTVVLLVFAVFPILTKTLWSILFDSFYHAPDPELAKRLDEEARLLAADRLRLLAEGDIRRERKYLEAERRQLDDELGLTDDDALPRGGLTRDDGRGPGHQDTATAHDTTTPGEQDTAPRQDTAPVLPVPSRDTRQDTTRRNLTTGGRTALPTSPAAVTPVAAQPDPMAAAPRPTGDGHPSVPEVILTALADGVDKDDKNTLRARVEAVHGPIREKAGPGEVKADTWRTSYRRAVRKYEEGTGGYL